MTGPIVGIQPSVLRWARESQGHSLADVALHLKRDIDEIIAWESGEATDRTGHFLTYVPKCWVDNPLYRTLARTLKDGAFSHNNGLTTEPLAWCQQKTFSFIVLPVLHQSPTPKQRTNEQRTIARDERMLRARHIE